MYPSGSICTSAILALPAKGGDNVFVHVLISKIWFVYVLLSKKCEESMIRHSMICGHLPYTSCLEKKKYVTTYPMKRKKKKKKREKKITNKSNWRHNKLYSPMCIKDPAGLRNCSASKLPVLFVTTLIVLLNMPSPCWSCDSTMSSYSRPGDRFVITASDVSRERILSVRHSGKSTALYLRDFFHVQ